MPRTKGSKNRPKTNITKDYASQITEKQETIACLNTEIRSYPGCSHIKIALKTSFKKSEITHRPSQSINIPIKPPFHPSSPTRRSASGQSERPGGAPGPGRSEAQARQDETILHD